MSSKDSEETHTMRTKSHNIEIMMGNQTDEIIEERFGCLFQNYQKDLEESMRGSEFVFDGIDLLCYHLNRISLNRDGSYRDSFQWSKNKKAAINQKNNDDKCLQYDAALNHKQIKSHPQRISKIKSFIISILFVS